jgi:hypothetical protein
VQVPAEVREAAIAAFSSRRAGRKLVELLSDTFTDAPPSADAPVTTVHRSLLFGADDITVRVDVRYTPALTLLTLHVTPPQELEVEVVSPDPLLRLVVRGQSPLDVATTSRGPASLLVTGTSDEGTTRHWQTTWLAL